MNKPTPYRLFDPERREVIETDVLADEAAAQLAATELVESGEYEVIEIQRLEDGLCGYEYYRVGTIKGEVVKSQLPARRIEIDSGYAVIHYVIFQSNLLSSDEEES